MLNPEDIRRDFPILSTPLKSGKRLVYLDSAATSQKPQSVIDAIVSYYTHDNANVHRGIHELGDRSTRAWHTSRTTIAHFFGADPEEFVMVRNTTEALNMVAYAWGEANVNEGDVILATAMDHHSNLVPWQELAHRKGATLHLIPVTADGELDLSWLRTAIDKYGSTLRVVALPHISNTLGTINPVAEITELVHTKTKAVVVVDGAQAAPHMPVDFHALDIDFMAISAHKMLGPMGVGGLFVKKKLITTLSPWLFGGGMIAEVHDDESSFAEDLEDRFTAGTPDVASSVGWAAACSYLAKLGMDEVMVHDQAMVAYTLKKLSSLPDITIIGPTDVAKRSGSVAFVYKGVHAHDVAQILDSEGIAVRSGHHCTMPLHTKMEWIATTRVSFNVYTTTHDIDVCIAALAKVGKVFGT